MVVKELKDIFGGEGILNNPKNLDLSYKADLAFLDCLRKETRSRVLE